MLSECLLPLELSRHIAVAAKFQFPPLLLERRERPVPAIAHPKVMLRFGPSNLPFATRAKPRPN